MEMSTSKTGKHGHAKVQKKSFYLKWTLFEMKIFL